MRFSAMIFRVDHNSGVPVYRQIVDQIRFHLASGLLGPGDILPSTRAISEELGVNPMTVSKAFGILEEEGLLDHRPGRPLVVARTGHVHLERQREEQLRNLLEPVVSAAEQLGIPAPRAVALFRNMIQERSARRPGRKHA
jgi:GntR family transcriptional regulator